MFLPDFLLFRPPVPGLADYIEEARDGATILAGAKAHLYGLEQLPSVPDISAGKN
jgi:hypothetical protein